MKRSEKPIAASKGSLLDPHLPPTHPDPGTARRIPSTVGIARQPGPLGRGTWWRITLCLALSWISFACPRSQGAQSACDLIQSAVGGLLTNPNGLSLNLTCDIPAGAGELQLKGTASILGSSGIPIEAVILREGTTARLKSFVANGFPDAFAGADALIGQLARQLPGGSGFQTSAWTPSSLPLPRLDSIRLEFGTGNSVESLVATFRAGTWPIGPLQIQEPRVQITTRKSATRPEAVIQGRFTPTAEFRPVLGSGVLNVEARFDQNPNDITLSTVLGANLQISGTARLTNLRLKIRPFDRSLALGTTLEAIVESGPAKPVLKFDGDLALGLAAVGPSVSGTLELSAIGSQSGSNLAWDQPFGIPGVTVRNLRFGLGVAFSPAGPVPSRLEILGDGLLGTTSRRLSGVFGLGVDATDPANNYLIYTASSPVSIAAFIHAFSDASLPSEVEKGLSSGIQRLHVTVSPREMQVAGKTIPAGICFAGSAVFFGKQVDVDLRFHSGVLAMSISDIEIRSEGLQILRIGGTNGGPLRFSLDPGTDTNPPKPGLRLDGSVTVLGVSRDAVVRISPGEFLVKMGGDIKVLGTSMSGSLQVTADHFTSFDVPQDYAANIQVNIGQLQTQLRDLINAEVESATGIPLGNLFTDILTLSRLSLTTRLGLRQLGAAAAIRGSFLGQGFDEKFDINLNLTDTSQLFEDFLKDKVAAGIEKAFGGAGRAFTQAFAATTEFFEDVGTEIEKWFDGVLNDPKVTAPSNGSAPPNHIRPDNVLRFEVTAYLTATRRDGEGDHLEVYGQITCDTSGKVWSNKGANAFLFSRRSGNAVDNPSDGHRQIGADVAEVGSKVLYVNRADLGNTRVRVHARLWEFDATAIDPDDKFSRGEIDLPLSDLYVTSDSRSLSTGDGEDLRLRVVVKRDVLWGSQNGEVVRYGDRMFIRGGVQGSSLSDDLWVSGDRGTAQGDGTAKALVRNLNNHADRTEALELYHWTLYDRDGAIPDRPLQYGDMVRLSVDRPPTSSSPGSHWLAGGLGSSLTQVRTRRTPHINYTLWKVQASYDSVGSGAVHYGESLVLAPNVASPDGPLRLVWDFPLFPEEFGVGSEEPATAPAVLLLRTLIGNFAIVTSHAATFLFSKVPTPPNQPPVLTVDWSNLPARVGLGWNFGATTLTAHDESGLARLIYRIRRLGDDGLPVANGTIVAMDRVSSASESVPGLQIKPLVVPPAASELGVGLFQFQIEAIDVYGKSTVNTAPTPVQVIPTLKPEDFLGTYERLPVENDYHRGSIRRAQDGALSWINAANVSWGLTLDPLSDTLKTSPTSPYYSEASGKEFIPLISASGRLEGFRFLREAYVRVAGLPPTLVWDSPAAMTYGTPLGPEQLKATSGGVPGTFAYSPPAGTRLNAGRHTLKAVFTPNDLARYAVATVEVPLTVNRAPLRIQADPQQRLVGESNPILSATYLGFVNGDTPSSLDSPAILSTPATTGSPAGDYPILISGAADANYTITWVQGTLTVTERPSDSENPLRRGLVAYWNFDEADFQDSVGRYNGTARGSSPIRFVDGKPGFGSALQLNGENQFVEITGGAPDDLAFAGGSVSIAGWFRVGTFDTSWQALVAKGEGNSWRVARRDVGQGMAYAGGLVDTPAGTRVNDGAWHHFVAISDATGTEFGTALYIDGRRDAIVGGRAALAANGRRMMIGENPDARGREWEGEIDDLALWDRVLTEAEIRTLHGQGSAVPLARLLDDTTAGTGWTVTFDADEIPYTVAGNGAFTPAIVPGGPTENFLRLSRDQVKSVVNSIAFDRVPSTAGPAGPMTIEFDVRMRTADEGADGGSLILLPTASYGNSGRLDTTALIPEEPNLRGALGLAMDTWQNSDLSDNTISLHWDGRLVKEVTIARSLLNWEAGVFHHVALQLEEQQGRIFARVTLRPNVHGTSVPAPSPVTPFGGPVEVPGMTWYDYRLAFAARTGFYTGDFDLDNIRVQWEQGPAVAKAPRFVSFERVANGLGRRIRLHLEVPAGSRVRVDWSDNLVEWHPGAPTTAPGATWVHEDDQPLGTTLRFYRAVLLP